MKKLSYVATVPLGLDGACENEVRRLARRFPMAGIERIQRGPGFVTCRGDERAVVYLNMMLRIPSRILVSLCADEPAGSAPDPDDRVRRLVADAVLTNPVMSVEQTFVVDSTVRVTPGLTQQYLALLVKDGICDGFRQRTGQRPSVSRDQPDVRFFARCVEGRFSLAVDTSGPAMHLRGALPEPGPRHDAPMRENLAAGLLALSGWQELCWHLRDVCNGVAQGSGFFWKRPGASSPTAALPVQIQASGALCVPMCGSGTIALEAARMLTDAPMIRSLHEWGFARLLLFKQVLPDFDAVVSELKTGMLTRELWPDFVRKCQGLGLVSKTIGAPIQATDNDPAACQATQVQAERAGLDHVLQVACADFAQTQSPLPGTLVVLNPPYGVRLSHLPNLAEPSRFKGPYSWIGDTLKRGYGGCVAWIVSADNEAIKTVGLRPTRKLKVYNGGLECHFQQFVMTGSPRPGPQGAPADPSL
jgi:putative N6-adenine-specific DNA methylase